MPNAVGPARPLLAAALLIATGGLAPPVARPAPPAHVQTFAVLLETPPVGWAATAEHVDFAAVRGPQTRDAARYVRTVLYADPNLLCDLKDGACVGDGGAGYIRNESAFVHCDGDGPAHRATFSYDGGKTVQWLGDPASPALHDALNAYIARWSRDGRYDAVWIDDTMLPRDHYRPVFFHADGFASERRTPCLRQPTTIPDADVMRGFRALLRASSLPVVFEGLGAMGSGPYTEEPSHVVPLLDEPRAAGAMYEFAWGTAPSRARESRPFWQHASNDQLATLARHKRFFTLDYPRADDVGERGYVYASFLLTYDPALSVYGTRVATPSRVSVEPETQLVALEPRQTARTSVEELRAADGAYRREFARCAIGGRAVGPCIVAVNPDANRSVRFPARTGEYRRTLGIRGSGVARAGGDDGALQIRDEPPPPVLEALSWSIAFGGAP